MGHRFRRSTGKLYSKWNDGGLRIRIQNDNLQPPPGFTVAERVFFQLLWMTDTYCGQGFYGCPPQIFHSFCKLADLKAESIGWQWSSPRQNGLTWSSRRRITKLLLFDGSPDLFHISVTKESNSTKKAQF